MVKIYTESVRHFAEEYARKINYDGIKSRLDDLLAIVNGYAAHENYIKELKTVLNEDLVTTNPSHFDAICAGFRPFKATMSTKFRGKSFYELVVEAMGYDDARSLYRAYVSQMGIKTCVYCNAQYAISFVSKEGNEYAQFEIDHWWPKNKYPFLSISFYNFVPSCPSCNKHKGKSKLAYCLYSEVPKIMASDEYTPFVFSIPDANLSAFLINFNSNLLKIGFKSRASNTIIEKDYERFAINEMYELFKDEAAIAIKRFLFFSDAYRRQMEQEYSSAFTSRLGYEEFIYGVSLDAKGAFERPLGKMIQDIRAQLESSTIYFSWLKKKGYLG